MSCARPSRSSCDERGAATGSRSCTGSTSTSSAAAIRCSTARSRWRSSSSRIAADARELGLETRFFQTNHEGAFVEHLHALEGQADAILLNPGAWTHYAWAIRDALEIAALPALEIHLSDVEAREPWRRVSVIRDLCFATISGRGPDGYRDALELLREELERRPAVSAARRAADAGARARRAPRRPSCREREVDALLVGSPVDLRYLTGFTGTHGAGAASRPSAERAAQASAGTGSSPTSATSRSRASRSRATFEREIVAGELLEAIAGALGLAADASASTRRASRSARTAPARAARGTRGSSSRAPAPSSGCGPSRTPARSHASAPPSALADEALRGVLEDGLVGRTEREVAIELELRMRRLGAEAPSFPSIVAAGAHGALPHAEPREQEIPQRRAA